MEKWQRTSRNIPERHHSQPRLSSSARWLAGENAERRIQGMFGIGFPELIIILAVGLVIFGPGKLPELGEALGKGIRDFQRAFKQPPQLESPPSPKSPEDSKKPEQDR
jgi:TatA/E family protein of Tat protein translocase